MKKLFWLRLGVLGSVVAALVVSSLLVVSEPSEVEARTTSPYWERASNGTLFYKEGGAIVKQGVPLNSVCPGNAGYSFYNDGCYDTGMFSTGDGDLRFYSNRNSIMKLSSNGRVGIGTTTPLSTLQVNGGIRARGGAPGANGTSQNGYAFAGSNGDNDSGMFSQEDGKLDFYANNSRRMRITSGDICIGSGC